MSDINKLLLHVLLLVLMTGSMAGLFAGTALVFRPPWLLFVGRFANLWISTRPITRLLEQMIKIDRWFYRHHYLSGIFLLAGAIYLVHFFTGRFDKARALAELSHTFAIQPMLMNHLLDSAVLTILLGAAFALIISLFMLIRPSMLKGFEQEANQWVSLRRALKPFEISRFGVDNYVFQNVQMTGILLLLGSLYALSGLTIWL
jgi:hypothetical protein